MQLIVTVSHDEDEGVWFVESSDVPGLFAEAPSLDTLLEVITDVAPDLIVAGFANERLGDIEVSRSELIVRRQHDEPAIVVPFADLVGLQETLHLLSTPANAERLLSSIADLDAGRGTERSLDDA